MEKTNNEIERPEAETNNLRIRPSEVKGWGIDADPENDPTYPIKKRNNGEHDGYSWERPTQQPIDVEVLHSNERPNVSAAFGTATPPAGLSGMIRREAFKFSENSYGHWLPLMLADRVGIVEGVVDDLGHAVHIPYPGGRPLADGPALRALRKLVLEIEAFFDEKIEPGQGHAVDVEVARVRGTWRVVQARVVLLDG